MENGPLGVSANFCDPLDDQALSKNVFPLFRLCPTASHIHPDFPLLFHLVDTSAFLGTYSAIVGDSLPIASSGQKWRQPVRGSLDARQHRP